MALIGVISDTHGLVRPEAEALLSGVDRIVHAGDIGGPEVIARLEAIAPVTAIRGNIDRGDWAAAYPDDEVVTVEGRYLYILHDRNALSLDPAAAGFDVVVSGHSHKPKIETAGGVLYLNPGSAGPRRFTLPIALALLRVTAEGVDAEIREISIA